MKTRKLIILIGLTLLLATSCKDFLEPWPNGNYDGTSMWNYQEYVQGLVNRAYDYIAEGSGAGSNRNYNTNEFIYLDGASDDAVLSSSTHVMKRYALNSMTTSQDPFAAYWDRDYRAMALVNRFLQDRRGYNTRFIVKSDHWNDLVRRRLQGEAFALRAWFEWDLLQKFGGKATTGEILGFPIVTRIIDVNENINFKRDTYDDCVKQILADCDSAIKYLPIAHRDFLVTITNDLVYAGGRYWGRFDGISMKALKSTVYLTWASPRFNTGNDLSRWDSAAFNAKKVIDFKLTVDQTTSSNSFRPANAVNWFNPNSPEIVIATRYNTNNDAMERMFYPHGFQGNGEIGPSQELVNAFGDANGRPITHASTTYNPANPYTNREPRFYSAIWYNTAQAKKLTGGAVMYTFENWNEGPTVGKDAAGTLSDNSRTNYHIKKFVFMDLNWADASIKRTNHSVFLLTWTQMCLNFAEAANHVTHNANTALYGLTPKAAVKYLRSRKTYDGATPTFATTDPYLDEVSLAGEASFDDFVKRERRIETCFEGKRFYDLRRWTTGWATGEGNWESVLNAGVHGAYITQVTAPSTFTYNLNWSVEDRRFPSPSNPIPYNEMLRMSNLVQNVGWPSWN